MLLRLFRARWLAQPFLDRRLRRSRAVAPRDVAISKSVPGSGTPPGDAEPPDGVKNVKPW